MTVKTLLGSIDKGKAPPASKKLIFFHTSSNELISSIHTVNNPKIKYIKKCKIPAKIVDKANKMIRCE